MQLRRNLGLECVFDLLAAAPIACSQTAPTETPLRADAGGRQIDVTRLTLGKVVTKPTRNGLWSCRNQYPENAVGAFKVGPWISTDGTWDMTRKVIVDGTVKWREALLKVALKGPNRTILSNGLPNLATTGEFPVSELDDAYDYDRNPNSIRTQTISLSIPASPKTPGSPQCVGNAVGVTLDGPALFNAVDEAGRDAVAHEVQDSCSGHPEVSGTYHYHGLSLCAAKDQQYGWALDGFPIWGPVDPVTGRSWTNEMLDECHGTTSEITVDNKKMKTYHYVANNEFPYVVGCFKGLPSESTLGAPPEGFPPGPPPPGAPGNS
jgi:YHYH protein